MAKRSKKRHAAFADPPMTADAELPRSSARLLLDRTYGPYFGGRFLWASGVWVYTIAAAIVVFQLTRSTLLVGMVSVAHFLPQMLLTPWSGAQADRGDRRRQVIHGRLISGFASSGLVLWIVLVGLDGRAGAAAIICAALATGVGDAYGAPAAHALVPRLVRPNELPAAVALDSIPFTAARAFGPALGAMLVVSLGPQYAFGFAAFASFAFAVIVAMIAIEEGEHSASADRSVRGGLRYIKSEPVLAALLIGVAAIGMGVDPVVTLAPAIAEDLGGGSSLVGSLASAFGIGAGAAFLLLGVVRRYLGVGRQGPMGLTIIAIGMLALAGSTTAATAIAAMAMAGVGYTFALTALTTAIQQVVKEEMRGRVMAIWAVAFLGSRPLVAAMNGAIADGSSESAALVVVVLVVLGGAIIVRPSRTAV